MKTVQNARERIHLEYPDDHTVLVIVPISAKDNRSSIKKAEIREKYLNKFKSYIPEIRLCIKDQLAIRRKFLANENDKKIILKRVQQARRKGNKEITKL